MTALDMERTVGQLVAERPGRANVFDRYGIDYCCGGRVPLARACQARGLNPRAVLRDLESADTRGPGSDTEEWPPTTPGELVDFIVATHHGYLRRELPRLAALLAKVADAHAGRHPELEELRDVFSALREELEAHLVKEEWIVFPAIRRLAAGTEEAEDAADLPKLLGMLGHEHDDAGAALVRMRALTRGYSPPADACNAYRTLLAGLAELEDDLHHHVHRENNILFPLAVGRLQPPAGNPGR
jgi:regulator of cell morphogenesis and NO signaling